MARPILRLWTDGSCQPNRGPGGWAFVVEQRGQVIYERSGGAAGVDAQTAELIAVAKALAYVADLPNPGAVQVCSDSQYVVDGVNTWLPQWIRNDWKAVGRRGGRSSKPIRNVETWQQVAALAERLPRLRPVRWVKAHSGAQFNSRADYLARTAAKGAG